MSQQLPGQQGRGVRGKPAQVRPLRLSGPGPGMRQPSGSVGTCVGAEAGTGSGAGGTAVGASIGPGAGAVTRGGSVRGRGRGQRGRGVQPVARGKLIQQQQLRQQTPREEQTPEQQPKQCAEADDDEQDSSDDGVVDNAESSDSSTDEDANSTPSPQPRANWSANPSGPSSLRVPRANLLRRGVSAIDIPGKKIVYYCLTDLLGNIIGINAAKEFLSVWFVDSKMAEKKTLLINMSLTVADMLNKECPENGTLSFDRP